MTSSTQIVVTRKAKAHIQVGPKISLGANGKDGIHQVSFRIAHRPGLWEVQTAEK
jgi:hypothetical protein